MTDTAPLAKTKVGPGTYTNATITVDEYGRITYAAPGKSFNNQILVDSPLTVSATFPQKISISAASTSSAGIVQLDDSVTSDAADKAATARSVKKAYEEASQARQAVSTATFDAAGARSDAKKAIEEVTAIGPLARELQINLSETQQDVLQIRKDAEFANFAINTKVSTSTFAAKGTLLVGTGSGTYIALSVGNSGEILTVDPEQPSGLKWVKPVLNTGEGLVGGPINIEGEISLSKTGILAGDYLNPTLTIDAYGRITAASDGLVAGAAHDNVVKITQLSRLVEKLSKKVMELERRLNQ